MTRSLSWPHSVAIWSLLTAGALVFAIGLCGWLLLQGAIAGGRYERYASGGTFFGARPVILPEGERILFSTPLRGHGDFVATTLLGADGHRVLSTPAYEGDADMCRRNGAVAFIREDADFVGHVWVAPTLSDPGTQLTFGKDSDLCPGFSPCGMYVAFSREPTSIGKLAWTQSRLHLLDLSNKTVTRLTDDPDYADFFPVWSPDGSQVLFVRQPIAPGRFHELWVLDVETPQSPRRICTGSDPCWSPDGKHIVFIDSSEARTLYDLFSADVDGRNRTRITFLDTTRPRLVGFQTATYCT